MASLHRCALEALLDALGATTKHIRGNLVVVLVVNLDIVVLRLEVVERLLVNSESERAIVVVKVDHTWRAVVCCRLCHSLLATLLLVLCHKLETATLLSGAL